MYEVMLNVEAIFRTIDTQGNALDEFRPRSLVTILHHFPVRHEPAMHDNALHTKIWNESSNLSRCLSLPLPKPYVHIYIARNFLTLRIPLILLMLATTP